MMAKVEADILSLVSELEEITTQLRHVSYTKEERNKVEGRGTEIYRQLVPLAHQLYTSWAETKQIKASKYMRFEMAKIGFFGVHQGGILSIVEDVQKGEARTYKKTPEPFISLATIIPGFKYLIKENQDPDTTYPYLDRIQGAVVIVPMTGYAGTIHISKINERGEFENYSDFRPTEHKGDVCREEIPKIVKSMVGRKVIFFPIETQTDYEWYSHNHGVELPFEFEVRDWEGPGWRGTHVVCPEKLVRKIVAEEYEEFTEADAERVNSFLLEHTL